MLLFASEIRGLFKPGPGLFRGHARRGHRFGEGLLPTSTAAPSPNVPASHPHLGSSLLPEGSRLFLLLGAAGLPSSICSPGGLLGRHQGRLPGS